MSITVRELKELGYKIIHQKAVEYSIAYNGSNDEERQIGWCFNYSRTVEGSTFWAYINNGMFEEARELFPNLFEKSNRTEDFSVVQNGLFK